VIELLVALLGGLVNRVRGGGILRFRFVKAFYDCTFACTFTLLTYPHWCLYTVIVVLGYFLTSWLGRSFGWGAYIGGILRKEIVKEEEVQWIDEVISGLHMAPVYLNTLALSLRGLMWTSSVACATLLLPDLSYLTSLIVATVGLTMGPSYLASAYIGDKIYNNRDLGWSIGEYVFGAVLWGSLALLLV